MLGSTAGIAAAANFPSPFVDGANADVAIVVGAAAKSSDVIGAADIGANLATKLAAITATGSTTSIASVSGEAVALDSSSQ